MLPLHAVAHDLLASASMHVRVISVSFFENIFWHAFWNLICHFCIIGYAVVGMAGWPGGLWLQQAKGSGQSADFECSALGEARQACHG